LHIYCTAKSGGGGKPNLVAFKPYTYWTQIILSVYMAPCRKNLAYGFYELGGPKINKIRVLAIITLILKMKKYILLLIIFKAYKKLK